MYKTMLNKINVYSSKIILYFKKYKCNYYTLMFVLFFSLKYVDVTTDKVNYLSKVHYSTYTLHIRPKVESDKGTHEQII